MSGYNYYKQPSDEAYAYDDGDMGRSNNSAVTHYKLGGVVVDSSSDYMMDESSSSRNYRQTERYSYKDQESGRYSKATVQNEASRGDIYKERGSYGRVGYKDEVKQTSTFRVGDKSGYVEYQYQERVRKVDFNKSINNK